MPARTKPVHALTLHDRLSRLTLREAEKLLGGGADAARLIRRAGAVEIDPTSQVHFDRDVLQVAFPTARTPDGGPAVVSVTLDPRHRERILVDGSHEGGEEIDLLRAAVLSFVLEEKVALGLAEPPPEAGDVPWESMDPAKLEARALAEREARALEESMRVVSDDRSTPWTDYRVTSASSGKSYRVAMRGLERGQSYCTCPDFRKNRLGTCKHVIKVRMRLEKQFPRARLARAWTPDRLAVVVRYDGDVRLALETPSKLDDAVERLIRSWRDRTASTEEEVFALGCLLGDLTRRGVEVALYPDAEEILEGCLHRHRMAGLVEAIRSDPAGHPLRRQLLHIELLPYQLDGIAFVAGKGRAILADEMGLGKTIQAVGVAELLAREAGIARVLVVCPASLKSQWVSEIRRFCDRSADIVVGRAEERAARYGAGSFFTICNYEQVLRDMPSIERVPWDLIILDEAQRIKNWEAKTSRIIKGLRSPFALVLTGTPLENRLDDLYSIMEFIDDRRLGPAYAFVNRHRIASDSGRVLGYRNLDALREKLDGVLLRRTRDSVALELPPRRVEIVRVPATDEQIELHRAHMQVVLSITRKSFLSEMDLLRLQKALLMARMAADSTFLVDKQAPGYSGKLEHLEELLAGLTAESGRKTIVFSEWTTMLDLLEPVLVRLGAGYVRLDGKVPQKRRQQIVAQFNGDAECRFFLTTNAGSTGLNLQAADTVVNVDLPWNPALLEQRIARAHRMGQRRSVHVHLLVTEGSIEENLLATLSAKRELATAVLDPDSNLAEVRLESGMDELRRRLEILLGAEPDASIDESVRRSVVAGRGSEGGVGSEAGGGESPQAKAVAEAGGQLLASALGFLGQLMPGREAPSEMVVEQVRAALGGSVAKSPDGRPQLTITLPGDEALDALCRSLAALVAAAAPSQSATPPPRPAAEPSSSAESTGRGNARPAG